MPLVPAAFFTLMLLRHLLRICVKSANDLRLENGNPLSHNEYFTELNVPVSGRR